MDTHAEIDARDTKVETREGCYQKQIGEPWRHTEHECNQDSVPMPYNSTVWHLQRARYSPWWLPPDCTRANPTKTNQKRKRLTRNIKTYIWPNSQSCFETILCLLVVLPTSIEHCIVANPKCHVPHWYSTTPLAQFVCPRQSHHSCHPEP